MTKLLRWIPLALLLVVTLELTCRVEDWVRYRTPIFSRFRSQSDLLVRDADGAHGRPNARYQKWVMNALGMRGPAADSAPPAGAVRVITTGASETFGLYESDDREYPRQLEDTLTARLTTVARAGATASACGARRAQVLNAALPGMSLPTVEQDVRLRLARLHPAVVVYYPTPVQYLEVPLPRAAAPARDGADAPPLAWALRPRSLDRLRAQLKLLLPARLQTWLRARETRQAREERPAGWTMTAIPAEALAAFERDLRTFVGSVRRIGAVPVLATHANAFRKPGPRDEALLASWEKFYPRATGDVILAFDSAGSAAIERVGADSGVVVADVASALAGAQGGRFADFSHFTDGGAALVARTLAASVLRTAPFADCPVKSSDK